MKIQTHISKFFVKAVAPRLICLRHCIVRELDEVRFVKFHRSSEVCVITFPCGEGDRGAVDEEIIDSFAIWFLNLRHPQQSLLE